MQIEITWTKWSLMFTRQSTPSGVDKWLTIGPVHFRWTALDRLSAKPL